MVRVLPLAALIAAAALAPLSQASAQTSAQTSAQASPASQEQAMEAAAEALSTRMEVFAGRAERIAGDQTLTEAAREAALDALWADYEPVIGAFAAEVSVLAMNVVSSVLGAVNLETGGLAEVVGATTAQALSVGGGIVSNGAWASNDPEHMQTYGLVAEYALGQAEDVLEASSPPPPPAPPARPARRR